MKYILPLFFVLLVVSCDTSLQPEIISVDGKEYSEIVDPVIEHPKLITPLDSLRAEFTRVAVKNNFKGKVFLVFVVDSTGKVKDSEILKEGDPKINQEAKKIVEAAKFKPATQNGEPVSVRYAIPFRTKW